MDDGRYRTPWMMGGQLPLTLAPSCTLAHSHTLADSHTLAPPPPTRSSPTSACLHAHPPRTPSILCMQGPELQAVRGSVMWRSGADRFREILPHAHTLQVGGGAGGRGGERARAAAGGGLSGPKPQLTPFVVHLCSCVMCTFVKCTSPP